MPLPSRNPGEGHDDFVSRCMGDPVMVDEFDDAGQRRAVCESIWDRGKQMQTRHMDTPFELKTLDEDGSFAGYGSVFDVVDSYNERVAVGAFKRSLREHKKKGRLPALLWQHDPTQPVGVYTRMREDDQGLQVEGQLALRTARGVEAYELLKLGAVSGLSIGFNTRKSEYNEKTGIRTLTDVDLWETSIVTFPANDDARISEVRRRHKEILTIRELEAVLQRDAGLSRRKVAALLAGGYDAYAQRDAGQAKAPEDSPLFATVDRFWHP